MLKRALIGLGIGLGALSLCSMLLLVGGVLGGMMGYVSARYATREVAPQSREEPAWPDDMWPEAPDRQWEEPTPGPLPYQLRPGMLGALVSPVRVTQVEEDSPAAEAGLRVDDVIIAIDGMALDANHDLSEVIRGHDPGDKITLTLIRSDEDTEIREVEVTLGRDRDEAGQVVAQLGIWYQHMSAAMGPLPQGEGSWD
jgi:membrane-associated protease RseP (regulator of RpoE activity)